MSDVMSVRDAAKLWNLTERRVTALCNAGRLEGAVKEGKSWAIPSNTAKPVDKRVSSGEYLKINREEKRALPVGVSSYKEIIRRYYFVDKTMLIQNILEEQPKVTVFARPCKFGKTLILDMLRTFFENTGESPEQYFRGKKIWECSRKYRSEMGKYPVITLSFRIIASDWEKAFASIKRLISAEFCRHKETIRFEKCSPEQQKVYLRICSGDAEDWEYCDSVRLLCELLHLSSGEPPVILLDDYDFPMQEGGRKGYYQDAYDFLRAFFTASLQDNLHISYAFTAGVFPADGLSLFSGAENLVISAANGQKFSPFFGFTQQETEEIAEYCGASEKMQECREWYGGYRIGTDELYNPWSVTSYFQNRCTPCVYWKNPLGNDILLQSESANTLYGPLQKLMAGETTAAYLDPAAALEESRTASSAVICSLLLKGYLTAVESKQTLQGTYLGKLAAPNRETGQLLRAAVIRMMRDILSPGTAALIQEAFYSNQGEMQKEAIALFLKEAAAGSDEAVEQFYRSLTVALDAVLGEGYRSEMVPGGSGLTTVYLLPKDCSRYALVMVLKAERNCSASDLKRGAAQLLRLVMDRKTDMELEKKGYHSILRFGVGICGRNAEVAYL